MFIFLYIIGLLSGAYIIYMILDYKNMIVKKEKKIKEKYKDKFYTEYYPETNVYYPKINEYYLSKQFGSGIILQEDNLVYTKGYKNKEDAERIIILYKEQRYKENVIIEEYKD